MHDPTTLNRQGPDIGTQYRSVIFYIDEDHKNSAAASLKKIEMSGIYKKNIVTEIVPASKFYPAEDYHQKYYEHHKDAPYCEIIIAPKLEKLQKRFKDLIKQE